MYVEYNVNDIIEYEVERLNSEFQAKYGFHEITLGLELYVRHSTTEHLTVYYLKGKS